MQRRLNVNMRCVYRWRVTGGGFRVGGGQEEEGEGRGERGRRGKGEGGRGGREERGGKGEGEREEEEKVGSHDVNTIQIRFYMIDWRLSLI